MTSTLFCISAWDDVLEAEGGGRDEQAQAQGDEERHPTQGGPQQGKGDSSHDSIHARCEWEIRKACGHVWEASKLTKESHLFDLFQNS